MVRFQLLLCVACGILTGLSRGGIPRDETPPDTGCVEYRVILERSVVQAAAIFFSENPLLDRAPITPSMIRPLNVANLYKEYYGEGASSEALTRVILDILYADPGCPATDGLVNKIDLRARVYMHAKGQNLDVARKQFGILLHSDMSELNEQTWRSHRCVLESNAEFAKGMVSMEISRLRQEIGEWSFKNFFALGVGPTLAFAIDDTGSMAEEIEAVRRRINLLIDQRVGSLDQPRHFVLVPFNDPKVGPVTSTNDADKIKGAIEGVYAHGGGDLPELSMRGISKALDKCSPGSTIYVITDAEARDAELQDRIIAVAKKKRIKLTFLLTHRMTSWLCAGFASTRRLKACRDPSLKLGLELYEHLASSTGGEALVIPRSSIFKATELVDISLKHALVGMEKRALHDGGNLEIFVDSDVTELYVYASGSCNKARLRTAGSPVRFQSSTKVGHLFVGGVSVTTYGRYSVVVTTPGVCAVTVLAKSTKGFIYTLAKELGNETDSQCLEVIYGDPSSKDKVVVLVDMYGLQSGDVVRTVFFVDEVTGETVQTFRVKDGSKRHFRVHVEAFQGRKLLVFVGGLDANGFQFRRLALNSMRSRDVVIDCSQFDRAVLRADAPGQVPVLLRNMGSENQYYTVDGTDNRKFIASVSQARVLISSGDEAKFFLRLRVPSAAKVGDASKVTITAKDQNGTLAYKECLLTVAPKQSPVLEYYRITSNINTRFAETIIQKKFVNDGWSPREATFFVTTPKDAFITEFTLTVGGTTYPAEIRRLNDAKTFYEIGKREGFSLGIASASLENTVFQTSVNLKGDEDVVFQVKYQQQLVRTGGRYRHEINVQPGLVAGTLSIEVNIWESLSITGLRTLNFETEQSSLPGGIALKGVAVTTSGNSARVFYSPTEQEQTQLSQRGLNGKFIVEYDLLRPSGRISEMVAFDSNFLNFFVPDYPAMKKRVVFLLDNSASMFDGKLEQLKIAMASVLDGLKPEDSFSIVFYNSKVQSWDPHPGDDSSSRMVKSTPGNIASAKRFLDSITAHAGTDLLQGLEIALNVIEGYAEDEVITPHFSTDFILLICDGRATVGEGNSSMIVSTISALNKQRYGIHAIGFGWMADTATLSNIAKKNNGRFISIRQVMQASEQIQYFFQMLANPMLRDIRIRYPSKRLIATTDTDFDHYRQGGEIAVAGRFANKTQCLSSEADAGEDSAVVSDVTFKGKTDGDDVFVEESLVPQCDENKAELQDLIEKQEKYLQLTDALKQLEEETNETRIDELHEKIFNLSTENSFVVRDHTALVVSKPDDMKEVDETIAAELEDEARRLIESTTTTPATRPSTTPSTVSGGTVVTPSFGSIRFSTLTPFTASRPRVEYFGDPHFVIDIEQQITLCFNWDGEEGQIINLLHDPLQGITVNGRLANSKAPSKSVRSLRTYVDKVGIFIQSYNISIVITPKEAVLRIAGKRRITLPFGKHGSRQRNGVVLKVVPLTKFKSTLFVYFDKKIVFRVISRINSKNEFVKDHLDFAVIEGDLSESAIGVLGQFSRFKSNEKVPASIEFRAGGKSALLWYRHNPIEVWYHTLRDYNSVREIECWYMADKKQLWENNEDVFVVKGILEPPQAVKMDHR